jgi:hypothetical protein
LEVHVSFVFKMELVLATQMASEDANNKVAIKIGNIK